MADFISTNDTFDHSFIAGSVYYWQYYGLKQSPFEETSHFAMYYSTPNLQEHLNYLRQFCHGEQPLLLIQGELGAGKTTLITQFLSQLEDHITHYQIKARETISAAEFANQIALGFQLPIALDQPTLRERLDTELQALQLEQKTAVLVIEDADLLPIESWVALTHMALAQLGQSIHLYMILTSESRLENQIQQFALEQGQSFRVPTLQLMPLNFPETQNYVKHRLIKSGLSEKMPFTKDMMQRIYDLSDGIPGRINRVAQQMLIEMLKPDEERLAVAQNPPSFLGSLWGSHSIKFVSGILLALVLLALLKFRHGEEFLRPVHATNKQMPVIIHNPTREDNSNAIVAPHAAINNASQAANTAAPSVVTPTIHTVTNVTNTAATTSSAVTSAMLQTNSANAATPASAPNVTSMASNSAATVAATPAVMPTNTAVSSLPSAGKGPSTTLTIPPESSTSSHQAATASANVANNSIANLSSGGTPAAVTTAATIPVANANAASSDQNSASTAAAVVAQNQTSTAPAAQVDVHANSSASAQKEQRPHHHAAKIIAASKTVNASEHHLLQMQGFTLQIIGARDASVLQAVIRKTGLSESKTHEFKTSFANKPWYVLVYGNYSSSAEAKAAIKKLPKSAQQLQPWIRPLSSVHAAIKQR